MTIHLPNNHIAVKVPEDAKDSIELHQEAGKHHITYHTGMGTESYDILRDTLPSGTWSILSLKSQIIEEQAAEVVNYYVTDMIRGYRDYVGVMDKDIIESIVDTALESFQSLCKSLKMEGEYIILKQQQS